MLTAAQGPCYCDPLEQKSMLGTLTPQPWSYHMFLCLRPMLISVCPCPRSWHWDECFKLMSSYRRKEKQEDPQQPLLLPEKPSVDDAKLTKLPRFHVTVLPWSQSHYCQSCHTQPRQSPFNHPYVKVFPKQIQSIKTRRCNSSFKCADINARLQGTWNEKSRSYDTIKETQQMSSNRPNERSGDLWIACQRI